MDYFDIIRFSALIGGGAWALRLYAQSMRKLAEHGLHGDAAEIRKDALIAGVFIFVMCAVTLSVNRLLAMLG